MAPYDVIVIGGGPAGLMAGTAAARAGARVLLVEKGNRLGRKLIISGGGRCNVTNRKPFGRIIEHIPGNGRFLYSAFHRFGPEQIIALFEGLGIKLKEEDNGRMFPVSDRAVDVANALIAHLRSLGVAFRLEAAVDHLLSAGGRCAGVAMRSGEAIAAGAVVVAVGGCSVPRTGSTGDGYAWARAAGHTITPLYPAEVPLLCADGFIADRTLQGLSLQGITQTLYDPAGKRLTTQRGDMLFTHFGLSGPAALRTSHHVSVAQLRHGPVPLRLTIDLFPDRSAEQLAAAGLALWAAEPKKQAKNILGRLLPERLVPLLLAAANLDPEVTHAHLPRPTWEAFCRLCKALPLTVTGTLPMADAFVTGGGVSIREVDPRSMASKRLPGLFFAGEVLDVHAHTGGYNITVAFATGWAAGEAAAAAAQAQ